MMIKSIWWRRKSEYFIIIIRLTFSCKERKQNKNINFNINIFKYGIIFIL